MTLGNRMSIAAAILCGTLAQSAVADPGFVVRPTGQALSSTCQSYALGIALAFKRDPGFKVNTAAELRATEIAIRAEIKKAAGTSPVNHDHIKKGFEAYTGGVYKLNFRDVSEAQVGEEAGKRSGVVSKASVPADFLVGTVIKDVLLVSATKIGNDSYGSGHILTLLGKDGPPNSGQQLLILNSAIKVKDTERNTCVEGVPDDPGPYTAQLSWGLNSDITFKLFGGKVRLWAIEKG